MQEMIGAEFGCFDVRNKPAPVSITGAGYRGLLCEVAGNPMFFSFVLQLRLHF